MRVRVLEGSISYSPVARDVDFEIEFPRIAEVLREILDTQQELVQRRPCHLFAGVLVDIDFQAVANLLKDAVCY